MGAVVAHPGAPGSDIGPAVPALKRLVPCDRVAALASDGFSAHGPAQDAFRGPGFGIRGQVDADAARMVHYVALDAWIPGVDSRSDPLERWPIGGRLGYEFGG